MVTALYRRYRPETFGEMIGQSQVTEPLMTALRTNRVNHAYLFSGPRGCGKTTSARILARCLNCAEGPTDTPCGVCPSCVELSRDGSGSLDVVEIDAASHNGVDDARDLRERAVFAPARDRYKIFILDEAHMVTPQGFNALLKIVEEPPEHIKFIFATTEPDKVIGTIRSRTHHYPFRLIPPAQLLEYVQALCEIEGVAAAPGVLPLVVRAGGGSARDTLSLLDQLIAGSESNRIEYERAVALLGYTHSSLLGEVVDALGAHDSAAAFGAVDRVIQTGQDPRRFVEDLLERLRDVIIVAATAENASAVLRGMPQDDLLQMQQQATLFGTAELSRTADIVNAALTEMTGATSPRLHLELMIARVLVPASDDTARGALARVERLERRVGVDGAPLAVASSAGTASAAAAAVGAADPATAVGGAVVSGSRDGDKDARATAGQTPDTQASDTRAPGGQAQAPAAPAQHTQASGGRVQATQVQAAGPADGSASVGAARGAGAPESAKDEALAAALADHHSPAPVAAAVPGEVTLEQLRDAWPEVLEAVQEAKRTAWMVVYTASVRALAGDVLTLSFPSENDVASFKEQQAPGQGVSEYLRQAILEIIGLRVKFIARVDVAGGGVGGGPAAPQAPSNPPTSSVSAPNASVLTASVPTGSVPSASVPSASMPGASAPAASAPSASTPSASTPTVSTPAASTQPASGQPSAGPAGRAQGGTGPQIPAPGGATPPATAARPASTGSGSSRPASTGSRPARPASTGSTSTGRAPAGAPTRAGTPGGSGRALWPTVAIPTSAPEPGDEPLRAGAIPVSIPNPNQAPGQNRSPDQSQSGRPSSRGAAHYEAERPAQKAAGRPGSSVRPGSSSPDPTADIPDFVPDDLPDDIPEGDIPDYDESSVAAAWADPSSEIPIDAGPTDWDPSDSAPRARPVTNANANAARGSAAPATEPATSTRNAPSAQAPRGTTPPPARPGATPPTAPRSGGSTGSRAAGEPRSSGPRFGEKERYGEAVVREILGASFIEERPVAPRSNPGAVPGRDS
ncbi:DNA polymerase III subunit gamma and tau [Subtercola sp. PAMC28395]|uniref:DNA polymerase III subunit gamma and tau n=1 Tax=Subtercola sp. PAMC28395 TaxID=2846775 RepID=UPI001C0D0A41|nr:DNA polymerase III subunit gamma and tau [Subtercola sp. PAMC28395]QWT24848.1 DNA polymerase III subunit gamma and tau [Subtercola sp. PAMC28395]